MVIKRGVNILWVTEKQGSKFYVAKAGRVKILWKLKYGGQISIFFSWNPWSKFYVPWKGGSKFYIFSQCLEKGGSKTRSLPTNFTEGVPPPGVKDIVYLPYRLRPEQTTVLEQLGQCVCQFAYWLWEKWMFNCFPKLMDLLRPYKSNSSITWSYLWGGLVRGKKIISLSTPSYPKDGAHFVRLV